MSVPYLVAFFSWPLIAGGIAGFYFMRQRKNLGQPQLPTAIRFLSVAFLLGPVVGISVYCNETGANLFAEDLLTIPLGCFIGLASLSTWRKTGPFEWGNSEVLKRKLVAGIAAPLGAVFILFGASAIVGDFMLERREVVGVVTDKFVQHSRRASDRYYFAINGRKFPTTSELYGQINPASRVQASVGRVSGTIFGVATLAGAPRTDRLTGSAWAAKPSNF